MHICYLDCHEAGLCRYLVIHIRNPLRALQLFCFHLWQFTDSPSYTHVYITQIHTDGLTRARHCRNHFNIQGISKRVNLSTEKVKILQFKQIWYEKDTQRGTVHNRKKLLARKEQSAETRAENQRHTYPAPTIGVYE
jgi:hypothetical protein